MSRITRELAILHTRAGVLSGSFPQFVSPFELDLIAEVARRRAAFGDAANLTDLEAQVIREVVEGLERGIRRMFSGPGVRAAWGDMEERVAPRLLTEAA